jgi:hypothetical protein
LIADLAVLKWNTVCIFFSILAPCLKAFALTGRGDSAMRDPQGVASLALGYVLHWAFSPLLLNPKLEYYIYIWPFLKGYKMIKLIGLIINVMTL